MSELPFAPKDTAQSAASRAGAPQSAEADTRAREQATDPRRSILLQAPAGSGKTTVLTQRLLRLLAEVDEPEEILAITFTRKAAAEMRARVLKALNGEIDPGTEQGERLRALAAAALQRADARGWNLVDDPGRLRIQTIDAFNFRLASQLPVTARAGGALVIADRPNELYRHAARRTLIDAEDDETLAADAELLFERLDNNWRKVEQLLEGMLHQRGHWLRYVLAHEPGALCARISASLANICRDHLTLACDRLPEALRREAGLLPHVGAINAVPDCLEAWKQLAKLCLTQKGEWRKPKGVNRALGPLYEEAVAKDALRACIERLSGVAGAREMLFELGSLPPMRLTEADAAAIEALSRLLRFAAAHLQAEFAVAGRVDHTYVAGAARAALSDAGLPTDLALQTGLSLRHILVDEFQDTSLAQFDLIEALTAGWDEGDGRTLFVVGDPMQSIYQFREAEVGLFLRARDHGIGNVRLQALQLSRNFRSVPELIDWTNDAFTRLFPEQDDLRASAVAFTPSLAARGPSNGDQNAAQQAPAIQLRLFPGGDRTGEASAIAERIAQLRRLDPESTIAVLVASRAHAVPIIAALDASQIPAIGVDLIPLSEVSIVRDLVALMQALHHLGDRTAWLAVLRAPWCGISLAALTAISQRRDSQLIWEAIGNPDRLAQIAVPDQRRISRVREVLEGALATMAGSPLADWLERTWLRLGAADAYPREELRHARAFFTALSDRVASGEWRGPQDLGSLLSDLFAQPDSGTTAVGAAAVGAAAVGAAAVGGAAADGASADTGAASASCTAANPGASPPPSAPSVQIMTIHRAKGLEFDHVFLPGLDRDLGKGRDPLLRWLDLPRPQGESDLVMAPVPVVGDEVGGEVGKYLKRLMSKRGANEQARLLYVAATRGKQTLFLSGAPKTRTDGSIAVRSGSLLASLWSALGASFQPAVSATEASPAAANAQAIRRLSAAWSPPHLDSLGELPRLPIANQSLDQDLEFSWVQETSRSIGTIVHSTLEQFATAAELPSTNSIEANRDEFAHQLRRHGVPDRELRGAVQTVVDALTRTVGDARGRWIFSPEHSQASSEWALTGLAGGRLANVIIDRSFVDRDGTRWVIDFKTSRHEGGGLEAFLDREMERYQAQLHRYIELARAVGSNPVRAALYFPLLGAFRELT